MGIPGLARTLEKSNNYKKYNTVIYKLDKKIDHLLFDFNGIVYVIEKSISKKYKNNNKVGYEKLLISSIIKYLQKIICEEVKPEKTVFIAIDGPVPRGKIFERKRRYSKKIDEKYRNDISS